jgi:lipopolysaccharide transport system ATP-binding protein
VRIYSSGMVIRLGFALATAIRPQILLMDEWFLAGDAAFFDKARARLEDVVRGADILVLSSHSEDVILDWCSRVFWMDQGRVREDGAPAEVLEHYLGRPPMSRQARELDPNLGNDAALPSDGADAESNPAGEAAAA